MTDVENTFRAELNRMLVVDAAPNWDAVVVAAGVGRGSGQRRQRLAVAAAALLAAAAVALVTPLGGAIARGLEEFSTWLTGEPGTPVSDEEQRAFDQEMRRWQVGFPAGTELRRLITRHVGDSTIELFGVRSAGRLCLRLIVSGTLTGGAFECAPLAELRREGGSVRVLIADNYLGRGARVAWYGIERAASAQIQITAGIAADAVDAVVLRDDAGRHEATVESNAFLYVDEDPEPGQRVREVHARTPAGLVAVPFAPIPSSYGSTGAPTAPPPAPAVEREVSGGTIGWLEDRERRGEPLDVISPQKLSEYRRAGIIGRNIVFGRVVTPDPARPVRLVIALAADRPGGEVAGICNVWIGRRVGSGSCAPYPLRFERAPFSFGMSGGGPGAFITINGVASDDVARLEVLLADATKVDVPLADNAFIVDVPRAGLPGRVVAYDSDGRVISSSEMLTEGYLGGVSYGPGEPARGRVELILRAEGPGGSYAELAVGPSTLGDECMYLKTYVGTNRGPSTQCHWQSLADSPVQVNNGWRGGRRFVNGRVRDDVKSVRIRFADGETVVVKPRRGYVLYALPADRFTGLQARRAVGADGLDASGRVIGHATFREPPGG